jgi:hypothetical protein
MFGDALVIIFEGGKFPFRSVNIKSRERY